VADGTCWLCPSGGFGMALTKGNSSNCIQQIPPSPIHTIFQTQIITFWSASHARYHLEIFMLCTPSRQSRNQPFCHSRWEFVSLNADDLGWNRK
jgi:hypothetical protein